MTTETAEAPGNRIPEEEKVNAWRTVCFHEILGLEIDEELLSQLVTSPVDLNEARMLKLRGCPVDLIPKILL